MPGNPHRSDVRLSPPGDPASPRHTVVPVSIGPVFSAGDERVTRLTRTARMRALGGAATVLLGFTGGRGVITHSTAGVVSFVIFTAVAAALVVPDRPTLRPVPTLLLGGYLALLGFVGVGGVHSTRIGWFSLVWLVLGALGLLLVLRVDHSPAVPRAGATRIDAAGNEIPMRQMVVAYGFILGSTAFGVVVAVLGFYQGVVFYEVVGVATAAFMVGSAIRGAVLRRRRGYWGPPKPS